MGFLQRTKPLVVASANFAGDVALSAGLTLAHQQMTKLLTKLGERLGLRKQLATPLGQLVVTLGPTAVLWVVVKHSWLPERVAVHREKLCSSIRMAIVGQVSQVLGQSLEALTSPIFTALASAVGAVATLSLSEAPKSDSPVEANQNERSERQRPGWKERS